MGTKTDSEGEDQEEKRMEVKTGTMNDLKHMIKRQGQRASICE